MAKLIGSIDQLVRPLARVKLLKRDEELLALIDTGFNGELMMGLDAARVKGVEFDEKLATDEYASGEIRDVFEGRLEIQWPGQRRRVSVLVSDVIPPPKADAPAALIGTRLLRPHLLMIDFGADTLEIETQA
jgi:predicted aspartyl protease